MCIYVFGAGKVSSHMTKGEILAFSVPTNQKAKLPTRLLLRSRQPPVETDKGTDIVPTLINKQIVTFRFV